MKIFYAVLIISLFFNIVVVLGWLLKSEYKLVHLYRVKGEKMWHVVFTAGDGVEEHVMGRRDEWVCAYTGERARKHEKWLQQCWLSEMKKRRAMALERAAIQLKQQQGI